MTSAPLSCSSRRGVQPFGFGVWRFLAGRMDNIYDRKGQRLKNIDTTAKPRFLPPHRGQGYHDQQ